MHPRWGGTNAAFQSKSKVEISLLTFPAPDPQLHSICTVPEVNKNLADRNKMMSLWQACAQLNPQQSRHLANINELVKG